MEFCYSLVQNRVTDGVPVVVDVPWKGNVRMGWNRYDMKNWEFTLKACAKVAAATDGQTFDRLVVVFLKRMFWCIRVARLGASWPIKEIGPDWRSSIGLPLLLTVGAGSSACWGEKGWVADKVKINKRTEVSVRNLQHHRELHIRGWSCCGTYEPIPWIDVPSILPTSVCMTE